MKLLPHLLALLLPAALLAAPLRVAPDDTTTTTRIALSDPAKPGILKLTVPWADVFITAGDGPDITVTTALPPKGRPVVDDEGFRRLDEDTTFTLVEKDNTVTLAAGGGQPWAAAPGATFDIHVPRHLALVVRTQAGGDLDITGAAGDLDINSMNGSVVLRDITSSAVVNTMNGAIRATYRQAPAKPVSLTSMNGEIELQLPATTPANLRLRTHNGSIRTNFPDGILQAKTESATRLAGDPRASREAARAAAEVGREVGRAVREAMEVAREAVRAAHEAATQSDDEAAPPAPEAAAPMARQAPTPRAARMAPVPPVPPVPPLPPYLPGGKTVSGTLNGGGVDITLTSMNGSITLRQEK